ncbi:MAG: TIGR03960 family B12-binding radical SAM protein [Candidatus Eisenbacteria bacterium]
MTDFSEILEAQVLPLVRKPGRYVGEFVTGCWGLPKGKRLRVLLAFPDTCEVGVSNIGLRIISGILTRTKGVFLDFCFAPWPDFEDETRRRNIPLLSLCDSIPVREFDVVGFSVQYELQYANLLNMLDLAGIPLKSSQRDKSHPLVVAGGSCSFNPEPLSDFVDCFSIGDGEETIGSVCSCVTEWKGSGRDRDELLDSLAEHRGLYVPSRFPVRTLEDGTQVRDSTVRGSVRNALTRDLDGCEPSVFTPRVEVAHDRLNIEVMRGCLHGCRFCMAGYVYRPLRAKGVPVVLSEARRGFSRTGWEEISLVSLSTPDYPGLSRVLPLLKNAFSCKGVDVSLPSMRPDALSFELASELDRFKKAGITLAPEAGTRRLRNVINKEMEDEDIVQAITVASQHGWNMMKLYFMIGLPTETAEDVDSIASLVERALREARKHNRRMGLNVSISPFVPKAHTPFQWEEQISLEETRSRTRQVVTQLRRLPVKVKWRDPEVSFLEGVLARADRRVGEVVARAWAKGAKLDAWSDFFKPETWAEAFAEAALDPAIYTAERRPDTPLPWDHVEVVSKDFLQAERARAYEGVTTKPCNHGECHTCGILAGTELTVQEVCGSRGAQVPPGRSPEGTVVRPRPLRSGPEVLTGGKYRFHFEKKGKARFLSHLDTVRILTRALRASELPVALSAGYRQRPRVSFGPPLPLGFTSRCEYFDLELGRAPGEDPVAALNPLLPGGIRVLDWKRLQTRADSLSSACVLAKYEIEFPAALLVDFSLSASHLAAALTRAAGELAGRDTLALTRGPGSKPKEVKLERAVKTLEVTSGNPLKVEALLALDGAGCIRPDDLVEVLLDGFRFEKAYLRIERTALYIRSAKGTEPPM